MDKRGDTIVNVLAGFKVDAEIVNVRYSSRLIRYELRLTRPGIRVKKINLLAPNIGMALSAESVRIVAPVPGTDYFAVEIPRRDWVPVVWKSITSDSVFQNETHPLVVPLGTDIHGALFTVNLADMPHLLIAGATGAGKSVCVNTIICSLVSRVSPDAVRLVVIDPKRVEMQPYNDLPHLAVPVAKGSDEAMLSLGWLADEMDRRYRILEETGYRSLDAYNNSGYEPLPYLVLVIDELADLMLVSGGHVEDMICRIAQLGRAAGIHMIVATQRPDRNVITGTIKANLPSRISFAVASGVDSRVILDQSGAEDLLGKGDMLVSPIGSFRLTRVQGAMISDDEISELVTEAVRKYPSYETVEFGHVGEDEPVINCDQHLNQDAAADYYRDVPWD